MFDAVQDPAEESVAALIAFVIEDAEQWSEVALVAALRKDGSLTESEKEAIENLFKELPNRAEFETVEALIGRPFEHREVTEMLDTCIQEGDYIGTLGFAKMLQITLSTQQLTRLREAAEEAAEYGNEE